MANRIEYTLLVNDAGKVKVEGITKSFVRLDTAINKVNADLKTQAANFQGTSKNADEMRDKTGLAGAALVELSRTISPTTDSELWQTT